MKLRLLSVLLFAIVHLVASCEKDDPEPSTGNLSVRLRHHVDGASIQWDTLVYTNAAGFPWSLTRLHYYLSGFRLENAEGQPVSIDTVIYADASDAATLGFTLRNIPEGSYREIRFYVGLDPVHNISNSLPNTTLNMNMAWPDVMGGGYHFMKFEGNYKDTSGVIEGFAMHLGVSGNESACVTTVPFFIANGCQPSVDLEMNLNEWFRNPHLYDFHTDGAYIMNLPASLQKLSENGDDVFGI